MAQVKALVDKLLTNVSSAYIPEGYISEEALPTLSVKQKTGKIGKYGTSHLRIVNSKMAGRGAAPRFEPIIRNVDDTYSIESHGLEGMVTEDDYSNVEEPFDAEKDEAMGLTSAIWLEKEFALSSVLQSSSVITQNQTLSGTSQLSDYTNSDPLGVFKTAQNTVLDGCGFMPNRAVISMKVFNTLRYHPAILRTLGFADARAGQLTIQEVAKALGVDILHIGKVSYEAAKLGQTSDFKQMWGNHITFYYAPKTAAKYQKSLGYLMNLQGRGPRRVFKYPVNNPPGSQGIIVQDDYSFEIMDVKCAYLVKDAIA
jgi:hypothetical protein